MSGDDKVERGREVYNNYCLLCHGAEMINQGGGTYDLRRFPKDARARFMNSVANGRPPAMPSWKAQINERELDDLWAFVQSGGDPNRPATGGH